MLFSRFVTTVITTVETRDSQCEMNTLVLVSVLSLLFVVFTSVDSYLGSKVRIFPHTGEESTGKALYLTPLIEDEKFELAQNLSRVHPDIGNTTSYSGFFTTNKKCGNNLFFWFFPAQQDFKSAPLVLWLDGGLRGSFMFSLFEEVGPFNYVQNSLQSRNYSWNVNCNLLFIDQAVGTGYSFTEKKCYAKNETDITENLYSALIQFLTLFPYLQKNNFFIAGESYAGHFIPSIAYTIHKNNLLALLKINLKAMMIGSGFFDLASQINYGDYLYQLGFVDERQRQHLYFYQNKFLNLMNSQDWSAAYKTWQDILVLLEHFTGGNIYNYLPQLADKSNWDEFVQLPSTRRAIHVGSKPFCSEFILVQHYLDRVMIHSVKHWVEILLENKYTIVFYSGQLDVICGYPMFTDFVRSLNWTGQHVYLDATRLKWMNDGRVAGYVKGQNLLFEVLVRDAGHMVAVDQPYWAYQMINYLILEQSSGRKFLSYFHQHLKMK